MGWSGRRWAVFTQLANHHLVVCDGFCPHLALFNDKMSFMELALLPRNLQS